MKWILEPIRTGKRGTASRLRGRLERILDAEKAQGLGSGENPARWRGHLNMILPAQQRKKKIRHYPAPPWDEIPEFTMKLRGCPGYAPGCLNY